MSGNGVAPYTAAISALWVNAFMKEGLGVRLVAVAAFLAGAFAAALGALAATFFAGAAFLAGVAFAAGAAFLAGVFLAVAMVLILGSKKISSLRNSLLTAAYMLLEKQATS